MYERKSTISRCCPSRAAGAVFLLAFVVASFMMPSASRAQSPHDAVIIIMVVGRWERPPSHGNFTRATIADIRTSPAFETLKRKVIFLDGCNKFPIFEADGGYLYCSPPAGGGSEFFANTAGSFVMSAKGPLCSPAAYSSYQGYESQSARVGAAATVYIGSCHLGFDPSTGCQTCKGARILNGSTCVKKPCVNGSSCTTSVSTSFAEWTSRSITMAASVTAADMRTQTLPLSHTQRSTSRSVGSISVADRRSSVTVSRTASSSQTISIGVVPSATLLSTPSTAAAIAVTTTAPTLVPPSDAFTPNAPTLSLQGPAESTVTAASSLGMLSAVLDANPSSGFFLARLVTSLDLMHCHWNHSSLLPFPATVYPPLLLGAYPFAVYRGAILSNLAAVAVVAVICALTGSVLMRVRTRPSNSAGVASQGPTWWSVGKCPSLPTSGFNALLCATVASLGTTSMLAFGGLAPTDGLIGVDVSLIAAGGLCFLLSEVAVLYACHGAFSSPHCQWEEDDQSSWRWWLLPCGSWSAPIASSSADDADNAATTRHMDGFGRFFRGVRPNDGTTSSAARRTGWSYFFRSPLSMPPIDIFLSGVTSFTAGHARAAGGIRTCEKIAYLHAAVAVLSFALLAAHRPFRVRAKTFFSLLSSFSAAVATVIIAMVRHDAVDLELDQEEQFLHRGTIPNTTSTPVMIDNNPISSRRTSYDMNDKLTLQTEWATRFVMVASVAALLSCAVSITTFFLVRQTSAKQSRPGDRTQTPTTTDMEPLATHGMDTTNPTLTVPSSVKGSTQAASKLSCPPPRRNPLTV